MQLIRRTFFLYPFIAVLVVMIYGCATTSRDWRAATQKDTIAGYQQFIKLHPQSREAMEAKKQIIKLRVDQDWKATQSAGTIVAYQEFLESQPDSKYAAQAKQQVEQLGAERDWKNAQQLNTISAYEEYLVKHPNSRDASQAKRILEDFASEADWQNIKGSGTIEAYQTYYYGHPGSKYAGEALSKMNKIKAEKDWKAAVEKNTEDAWVSYIVKYSGIARIDEASRRLRKHTVIRSGGLIPWAALGGQSWSQEDPSRDGFSNLEGAVISNATVIRLPNHFGLECNDKTAFYFNHWVKLNGVKCKGDLKANSKGLIIVRGIAIIPNTAK